MEDKNAGIRMTILFLALIALGGGAAAQTYTVTDLGVLPGFTASQGFAVNSAGEVVGCSDMSPLGTYPCGETSPGHAFAWSKTTGIADLGVLNLGDTFSLALGISDSGQATGTSVDSLGNSAPFLWTHPAGMAPLPTFPGSTYGFSGQTNTKAITGSITSSSNPGIIVPVAWIPKSGNTYNIVQLPALPGALVTGCCSVNKHNQGVGFSLSATSFLGVLITSRGAKNLGTLPGGTTSNANWINSSGVIAGYSDSTGSGGNIIAVAWDPSGHIHNLGTLPGGTSSSGNGINDSNQIVGFSSTATSTSDAMIWTQQGGMKDLNSLIPPNSGWVLILANSINNNGLITGYGTINGANHAFLLTPQ